MRVALISDVHGNRLALEAVLRDLDRRRPDAVWNLGDCLYGPLDPAGTAGLLLAEGFVTVRGNEDRILLTEPVSAQEAPTLRFTRRQLSLPVLEWLGGLPLTVITAEGALLCHGTPRADNEYLLERVEAGGVVRRDEATLASDLAAIPQRLICCGHSHVFAQAELADGRTVVNAGSVGLPAYRDDLPFPHAMAAGLPHAVYALLDRDGDADGWCVRQVAVTYDWRAAAAMAEANGRPDWAAWLQSGLA